MIDSNSIKFNNTNKKLTYNQKILVKSSLVKIGFNPSNIGVSLFKHCIYYAYTNDIININMEEIYRFLSSKTNTPVKNIKNAIAYSFYNINMNKVSKNYEKIFGVEFDYASFSLNNIISDFIDLLDETEY